MSNDEKRDIEDRINDPWQRSSVILQESLSLKIKITDQLLTSRHDLEISKAKEDHLRTYR